MNEQNTNGGGAVWRPITLTDKATGRKVSISIFDRELYLSGFFTFEDLWEMYNSPSDGTDVGGDGDER